MPKELDVRALIESNMRPELVALAEQEGVTYSERGDKRHIATEILEAREAAEIEASEAELEMDAAVAEAELETDVDQEPVEVEAALEGLKAVWQDEPPAEDLGEPVFKSMTVEVVSGTPEVIEAKESLKAASAAFLAAGQVDGPERKARREAKAKLYALLA